MQLEEGQQVPVRNKPKADSGPDRSVQSDSLWRRFTAPTKNRIVVAALALAFLLAYVKADVVGVLALLTVVLTVQWVRSVVAWRRRYRCLVDHAGGLDQLKRQLADTYQKLTEASAELSKAGSARQTLEKRINDLGEMHRSKINELEQCVDRLKEAEGQLAELQTHKRVLEDRIIVTEGQRREVEANYESRRAEVEQKHGRLQAIQGGWREYAKEMRAEHKQLRARLEEARRERLEHLEDFVGVTSPHFAVLAPALLQAALDSNRGGPLLDELAWYLATRGEDAAHRELAQQYALRCPKSALTADDRDALVQSARAGDGLASQLQRCRHLGSMDRDLKDLQMLLDLAEEIAT